MEMPIVRAVPRMTAIASSACGAQIALTSIANRPQAYPAPLSRQLADDQQAESRGANETRFVAMGLATYAAVILETRASSRRSRAARDSPLSVLSRRKARLRSGVTCGSAGQRAASS